jgi:hypothetical protein
MQPQQPQQRYPNFETNFLFVMRESLGNPRVPVGATPQGVLALWGKRLENYQPEHLQAAADWYLELARWPESFREVVEWMDYRNFRPNNGTALEHQGHKRLTETSAQIVRAYQSKAHFDTWSAILSLVDEYQRNSNNPNHADYRFRSPNQHMTTEDYIIEAVNEGRINWDIINQQMLREAPMSSANLQKLTELYPEGRPVQGLQAVLYDLMHIAVYGSLPIPNLDQEEVNWNAD